MAYSTRDFTQLSSGVYGYYTIDGISAITQADYFSDFVNVHGGSEGDLILVSSGMVDSVVGVPNLVTLKVSGVSGNAGTAAVATGTGTSGLENMPASPLFFTSVKKLSSWSGAHSIMVNPDTLVETDIGFDSNGDIDSAAIATAQGGSDYMVVKQLYDQSGNGNHAPAYSADNASRPIVDASQKVNGKQGILCWAGLGNTGFTLPAGVTGNRNNVTVMSVNSIHAAAPTSATHWALGAFSGSSLWQQLAADKDGYTYLDSAFKASGINGLSQLAQVVTTRTNGSNLVVRVDGEQTSLEATSSGAFTGGYIARADLSGYYFTGDLFALGVWADGTLSDGVIAAAEAELQTALSAGLTRDAQILFIGDSLQYGQGSTQGLNMQKQLEPLLSSPAYIMNMGIPGRTFATEDTKKTVNCVDRFISGLSTNICHIQPGTNDINAATTADTLYNTYAVPYVTTANGAGYTSILSTLIARTAFTSSSESITGITQANPAVVTSAGHGLSNGASVEITDGGGMVELEDNFYVVRNVTTDTFELEDVQGNAVNSTGFTAYSSGGAFNVGTETERLTYNAMVRDTTNATANSYTVCDYAGETELQDATDTTYYDADGTHVKSAGYAVEATYLAPIINGLL